MSPEYGPHGPPYGPPEPPYGPDEHYGPPAPRPPERPPEPYGPYAPSEPRRPGEAPGAGPYEGPPTAPGAPSFPDIGRPGLPTPGELGGEEQRARPQPAQTIHVTPQDAQKIRAGVRLVPGAGNAYTLETRGGQSIGRVAAHGPDTGLVPVGFGNDGLVVAKGRPLSDRPATFDAGIRRGATEGVRPAPAEAAPAARPPGAPTLAAEGPAPAAGAPRLGAEQLHAAPLRPGRATWRSNVGEHEVEILPDEEQRGHHKVRYDITDRDGRHHRGEAWVRTEDLTQGYGPGGAGGEGGGPAPPAGGGRPQRGTMREQLQEAAAHVFAPSNEPITEQQERTIRGGLAPAKPGARQLWADTMQRAFDARQRVHERDLPT